MVNDQLYKKHRPKTLQAVVGQDACVTMLKEQIDNKSISNCMLFTGISGVGKTTLARIIANELDCHTGLDLLEVNCADNNGVDFIRDIATSMYKAPIGGSSKVYILDEFHQATKASQQAILKLLEDYPPHVYFFLSTSEEEKLIKAIHTRCTKVQLRPLSAKDIQKLLKKVSKKEKLQISEDILYDISIIAEGSARYSLVLLNKVKGLSEEDANEILSLEGKHKESTEVKDICQALLKNTHWGTLKELVKDVKADPETTRRGIIGYMNRVLVGNNQKVWEIASTTIRELEEPLHNTGLAGLTRALYEVSK